MLKHREAGGLAVDGETVCVLYNIKAQEKHGALSRPLGKPSHCYQPQDSPDIQTSYGYHDTLSPPGLPVSEGERE